MNYLVSYQHSGNTWLRYIIEYITKKPTHGHRAFSVSQRKDNILDIDIDAEPVVIKRHELEHGELKSDDRLLLILRKPTNCIKESQDADEEFIKYYKLLLHYEAFEGKKRIVYFSDIFDFNIVKNLIDVFQLTVDLKRVGDLVMRWGFHQKQSLSLYQNRTNEKGVKGFDTHGDILNHVRTYIDF